MLVVEQENNGSEGTVLHVCDHSSTLWPCYGSIQLLEICREKDAMLENKKSLGNSLKISMIYQSNTFFGAF